MKRTIPLLGLFGALSLSGCALIGPSATATTAAATTAPATSAAAPAAPTAARKAPQTYVLVHGAFLGEFSWKRVERQLVADGNTVITLDLPGHGANQAAPGDLTLNSYRDAVLKAIGDRSGFVLVGHSFGGMVISQVAEAIPGRISKLVYLSALIPQNGDTANALTMMDKGSLLSRYTTMTPTTLVLSPDGVQPVFCNDCSADDVNLLKADLRPEPLIPFGNPATLSAANYGSVPRYDIMTSDDHAISYPFQQLLMTTRGPFVKTFTLNSSHVSFLTHTDELTKILEGL